MNVERRREAERKRLVGEERLAEHAAGITRAFQLIHASAATVGAFCLSLVPKRAATLLLPSSYVPPRTTATVATVEERLPRPFSRYRAAGPHDVRDLLTRSRASTGKPIRTTGIVSRGDVNLES